MNSVRTFCFVAHQLRVITDDKNNPWFNGNDLCRILGYLKPSQQFRKLLDSEDCVRGDVLAKEVSHHAHYLNEAGLYALIFASGQPAAKPFKRWIINEIMPVVRTTVPTHNRENHHKTTKATMGHGGSAPLQPSDVKEKTKQPFNNLFQQYEQRIKSKRGDGRRLDLEGVESQSCFGKAQSSEPFKRLRQTIRPQGQERILPQHKQQRQSYRGYDSFPALLNRVAKQMAEVG